MNGNLQQAIAFIKSGDKERGKQLLTEVVKSDPRNLNAWLWLSSCVNNDEQRIHCLQKVLEIDPNHQAARSALSKLQQSEQPSEREILGEHEDKPVSMNTDNAQIEQKEKTSFQPKYLTAIAGMGIMMGTAFPWSSMVSGSTKLEEFSGLTQATGILTFVVGLAIIFLAIFYQAKPGKANSLISSLLACATLLMIFIWTTFFWPFCYEVIQNPDAVCYRIGTGFGYGFSRFSLFLALIFGLIPNPKEQ